MNSLRNRVAVVTGSSSGIGMGIALALAAEDAKVVVNGRNADKAQAVVQTIRNRGGEATYLGGSVLSQSEMNALVKSAIQTYGQVDIMVASSGGGTRVDGRSRKTRGLFHEIDVASVVELVANATAAKLLPAQAVVPHMIARNSGSIVFVTSEGGRVPTPGQTGVATFAGGLIMATKVLAKELSRHKIRVNCIAVTLVRDTPSWDALATEGAMSEHHRSQYAKIQERAPFGLASPEDIGAVAAFLASDHARLITGSTVSPTGGLTYS